MSKLKSRKFWLTLLATLSGIATALMAVGGKVGVVAGMIVAVLPTVVYVITEGKIDAQAIQMASQDITEVKQGIEELSASQEDSVDGSN